MLTKHLRELARHRIRPEKIVIQGSIGIHTLRRIQRQQLIQQITSVRIFNVRFQAFCKINSNSLVRNKRKTTDIFKNRPFTFRFCPLGSSILLYNSSFSTSGQISGTMEPQSWQINVSWCCSVLPYIKIIITIQNSWQIVVSFNTCMIGLRVHISAMMQPAPHMSTGGP